ncbi:MAG: hypothetical protein ACJ8FS_09095 [Sphingomicrobium sp.]
MGLILRQRTFEAPREERERPVEHSLEREPWRAFRSSLAVQFTWRRPGGWSAEELSDETKAEVISGLEARSAIISSYSRIQSAVRDLVAKAGFSARPGERRGAYSARSSDVLSYARSLTSEGGPLSASRQMLRNIFDCIEVTGKGADPIVRGYVEVHEDRSGAILFQFEQRDRRQSFTSKELNAKAVALELLARDAESRLATALALV